MLPLKQFIYTWNGNRLSFHWSLLHKFKRHFSISTNKLSLDLTGHKSQFAAPAKFIFPVTYTNYYRRYNRRVVNSKSFTS